MEPPTNPARFKLVREAPSNARGLKGVYGRFYARLYDDRANRDTHAGRDRLRRLVEVHALGSVPFEEGERIFRKPSGSSMWITRANAAKILGVSARVLDSMLTDYPTDTNPVDGEWRRSIPRGWAMRMRELHATTLDGTTVAKLLGIDVEDLGMLESKGLIELRAATDHSGNDRYCRRSIEGLLDTFNSTRAGTPQWSSSSA